MLDALDPAAGALQAEDFAILTAPVELPPDAPPWVREAAAWVPSPALLQKLRAALLRTPEIVDIAARFPPNTVLRCACCNGFLLVTGVHLDPKLGEPHLDLWGGPGSGRGCGDVDDPKRAVVCRPSGLTPDVMRMLLAPGDA